MFVDWQAVCSGKDWKLLPKLSVCLFVCFFLLVWVLASTFLSAKQLLESLKATQNMLPSSISKSSRSKWQAPCTKGGHTFIFLGDQFWADVIYFSCKTSSDFVFHIMDVFYFYIWNQYGFHLSLLIISYIYWVSSLLERADKQALGRQKSKPSFLAFADFHGGDTYHVSFQATDVTSRSRQSALVLGQQGPLQPLNLSPTLTGATCVLRTIFTTNPQGRYCGSHPANEEIGLENTLPHIT